MEASNKIALFIVAVGAFLFGRTCSPTPIVEERVEVRVDTVRVETVRPDTVYLEKVVTHRLPAIVKTDTVHTHTVDTVEVYVPISNYLFEEVGLYRAEVSGYEVSLESMEVYPKHTHTVETVKTRPKWGVGVQVGYGVSREGLSPYIGVGVQYNLITF